MSMSCAWIGADLLQDEDVSPVLLESDRVGFDVAQDSVEVVLIYTKKLTAVFPSDDSRRSANKYETKITIFQNSVQMELLRTIQS